MIMRLGERASWGQASAAGGDGTRRQSPTQNGGTAAPWEGARGFQMKEVVPGWERGLVAVPGEYEVQRVGVPLLVPDVVPQVHGTEVGVDA
jgi:hypothetical protein